MQYTMYNIYVIFMYIYIYNNKHTWLKDIYFRFLNFYGYLHFVYFADYSPVKLCITFIFLLLICPFI